MTRALKNVTTLMDQIVTEIKETLPKISCV